MSKKNNNVVGNNNTEKSTDALNAKSKKINVLGAILKKESTPMVLLVLSIVFFIAMLVSLIWWLPSQLRGSKSLIANKSIILINQNGDKNYIEEGDTVKLESSTLIYGSDTIAVGDSICNVLHEFMSDESSSQHPTVSMDTVSSGNGKIIVATMSEDVALSTPNKEIVFYSRANERYIVRDEKKKEDSISIIFNNKSFRIDKKMVKCDTVPSEEYRDSPFELMYAVYDTVESNLAIRFNRIDSAINIYPIYRDSLLGGAKEKDFTYEYKYVVQTSDTLGLRLVCKGLPTYVLIPGENVVHVNWIKKESSSNIIPLVITGILLSLFGVFFLLYLYSRRNNITYLKKRVDKFELKLTNTGRTRLIVPKAPKDIEVWFNNFNVNEGDESLFEECSLKYKAWQDRKASPDDLEANDKIEVYIEKFIASVQDYVNSIPVGGLEKKYREAKDAYLEVLSNQYDKEKRLGQNAEQEQLFSKGTDDREHRKIIDELKNKLSRLQKNEERLNGEIRKLEKKIEQAEIKAANAEKKAETIRQDVTEKFQGKLQELQNSLNEARNVENKVRHELGQTQTALRSKESECMTLLCEIKKLDDSLARYSARITDVTPAGNYAKQVEKLLQLGHRIEKSADGLLGRCSDDYLITKYITRYQKSLHCIDMDQFITNVLNIANVQFVYNQQQIAKYDQKDEKQFKESMKIFFFESYLEKYISALMVFNETLAGLYHLIDDINESDAKEFTHYRDELNAIFKALEISVHSVKIFDSITDNVDLHVEMRPLDFDCPSGTICQIDSCIVYLTGGIKPTDKIHVIVKE